MLGQTTQQTSYKFFKKALLLTIGGGLAFWATTIATSLLPIAADYRAASSRASWSVQTVWITSLPVGLIIAGCVSYALLRRLDKLPTRTPVLASAMLGMIALVIATVLIDIPRSFVGQSDGLHYFLIGIILNAPRFLFLGLAIGCLYRSTLKA